MLNDELRPRPEFGPICRHLRSFLSPRDAWAWLAAPITLLSGDVACELILSDPERVMRAARNCKAQLEE